MLYIFVFLGGFTSLVYQVIWQRLAAFSLGSDASAAAVVAAAFMTGLGLGSLGGALTCSRLRRKAAVLILFLIELAIAAAGVLSLPVLYRSFYLELSDPQQMQNLAPTIFLLLSLPTFLMGLSFPILTRLAVSVLQGSAVKISTLYGFNTLGAALGAIIGGFVLMRHLGLETTIFITAALNLLAALIILTGAKEGNELPITENVAATDKQDPSRPDEKGRFYAWCSLYALSGFVNLGLEIVWFRLLGVMLKSNTFTYSILLFFYLAGLGAGSIFAARCLKQASSKTFLVLQLALTVYTAAFLVLIYREAQPEGLLNWLHTYLGNYNPLELADYSLSAIFSENGELFRSLYFFLAAFMILPPTFMMGVSFYGLQNSVQTDLKQIGRRVGLLQMSNIAGGTMALLWLGIWGLKHLGTFSVLNILMLSNQIFLPIYFLLKYTGEKEKPGAAAESIKTGLVYLTISLLPCLAIPSAEKMWMALHGGSTYFDFEEDHTGIVAIKHAYEDHKFIFINGEGHSEVPFGSYHSQVGLLPLFLHHNPEHIAIIGLGSGDTAFSAASHKNTKSLTCIEIIEAQPKLLKRQAQKDGYEPLKLLFQDPRVKIVTGDGRRYIEGCGRKFDIIEADALRPFSSRAGMLYSKEYFLAMKNCLNDGGLLVTWLPTKRTYDTFRSVFPHHLNFGNTAIGSNRPISLDQATVLDRYRQFCLHERLETANQDGEQLLKQFMAMLLPSATGASDIPDHNSDLFPKDEFLIPQQKE
ncbi:MAG: fused MFS/spermidine synthase [Candidatus Melainabacteria bacterium]|nr:fused MFS/spermidine synthase [Candidatus Melainabacteria bacterium]